MHLICSADDEATVNSSDLIYWRLEWIEMPLDYRGKEEKLDGPYYVFVPCISHNLDGW